MANLREEGKLANGDDELGKEKMKIVGGLSKSTKKKRGERGEPRHAAVRACESVSCF